MHFVAVYLLCIILRLYMACLRFSLCNPRTCIVCIQMHVRMHTHSYTDTYVYIFVQHTSLYLRRYTHVRKGLFTLSTAYEFLKSYKVVYISVHVQKYTCTHVYTYVYIAHVQI